MALWMTWIAANRCLQFAKDVSSKKQPTMIKHVWWIKVLYLHNCSDFSQTVNLPSISVGMCRRLKLTGAISVLLLAGLSLFEIVLYHLSLYLCFVGTPQPATAVLMKQSHIALWETFKRSLCSFSVVLDHACAWFNSHSTEDAPVVFFACFFVSAHQ